MLPAVQPSIPGISGQSDLNIWTMSMAKLTFGGGYQIFCSLKTEPLCSFLYLIGDQGRMQSTDDERTIYILSNKNNVHHIKQDKNNMKE